MSRLEALSLICTRKQLLDYIIASNVLAQRHHGDDPGRFRFCASCQAALIDDSCPFLGMELLRMVPAVRLGLCCVGSLGSAASALLCRTPSVAGFWNSAFCSVAQRAF